MKGRPSNTSDDYVLVFDKTDKTRVFTLNTDLRKHACVDCGVPKFVHQMDDKLFAKIESVVDFNFGRDDGKSGYLLLLNIEGRPKTCFTLENEEISAEVRHKILHFC